MAKNSAYAAKTKIPRQGTGKNDRTITFRSPGTVGQSVRSARRCSRPPATQSLKFTRKYIL
uniref:Uncharacterized protein n=1 Tax=Romanomermis culicivorax TaxID=13658 RepID=A0A915IQ37_ROMCU